MLLRYGVSSPSFTLLLRFSCGDELMPARAGGKFPGRKLAAETLATSNANDEETDEEYGMESLGSVQSLGSVIISPTCLRHFRFIGAEETN